MDQVVEITLRKNGKSLKGEKLYKQVYSSFAETPELQSHPFTINVKNATVEQG